ncbi:MAG: sigma-54-dependent Fis family transcriptional regulator [Deltaproteobacteria bacterium]|nr:sigma-54-dependent Fis family transcriptional regulator [Deltaproteobacteria bacterium]
MTTLEPKAERQADRPRVLVVDDHPNMLKLMQKVLKAQAEVLTASGGREAIEILKTEHVNVVLSDLKMPEVDGIEVLRAVKELRPNAEFVLMTAHGTVATALTAMRLGAYDYLTKPFEPEQARDVVAAALARAQWKSADPGRVGQEVLPGMIAASASMRELGAMVRRVAPTDATVLILGETGTGKERIARAVHSLGRRAEERFVAVNCAAIPGELLESELFGYVKGSFTGAARDRAGLFEEADRGTLFLDELGDLRLSLQAKLTRVLEEHAIRRVGEAKERNVDVRIVAATHRELRQMVDKGSFREDLWYRLNVATIHVPPLRDRREDIELLAHHFLGKRAAVDPQATPRGFTEDALATLTAYDWPGNVRQLGAAVERASILSLDEEITRGDLPPEVLGEGASPAEDLTENNWQDAMEAAKELAAPRYLKALLRKHGGNVSAAARVAGVERESFYRLMRRYGVER